MERQPLTFQLTATEVMILISEGNPGAMSVIRKITEVLGEDAPIFLFHLDDMNIRGPQLWAAYNDHCECDINMLISLIKARDSDLIDTVNKKCSDDGEKAVRRGHSFR